MHAAPVILQLCGAAHYLLVIMRKNAAQRSGCASYPQGAIRSHQRHGERRLRPVSWYRREWCVFFVAESVMTSSEAIKRAQACAELASMIPDAMKRLLLQQMRQVWLTLAVESLKSGSHLDAEFEELIRIEEALVRRPDCAAGISGRAITLH
jgi:hypothetical protein